MKHSTVQSKFWHRTFYCCNSEEKQNVLLSHSTHSFKERDFQMSAKPRQVCPIFKQRKTFSFTASGPITHCNDGWSPQPLADLQPMHSLKEMTQTKRLMRQWRTTIGRDNNLPNSLALFLRVRRVSIKNEYNTNPICIFRMKQAWERWILFSINGTIGSHSLHINDNDTLRTTILFYTLEVRAYHISLHEQHSGSSDW